ncbi:hypothetical protein EV426DRAFT_621697, partial [Tirmania nivea]
TSSAFNPRCLQLKPPNPRSLKPRSTALSTRPRSLHQQRLQPAVPSTQAAALSIRGAQTRGALARGPFTSSAFNLNSRRFPLARGPFRAFTSSAFNPRCLQLKPQRYQSSAASNPRRLQTRGALKPAAPSNLRRPQTRGALKLAAPSNPRCPQT